MDEVDREGCPRPSRCARRTDDHGGRSGLQQQWRCSQDLVAHYFQQCHADAMNRRDPDVLMDEYIREWDLAQALVRYAVTAAFFPDTAGGEREHLETLARGLQILRAPEEFERDDSRPRTVHPGENLHPEDVEVLDAE